MAEHLQIEADIVADGVACLRKFIPNWNEGYVFKTPKVNYDAVLLDLEMPIMGTPREFAQPQHANLAFSSILVRWH